MNLKIFWIALIITVVMAIYVYLKLGRTSQDRVVSLLYEEKDAYDFMFEGDKSVSEMIDVFERLNFKIIESNENYFFSKKSLGQFEVYFQVSRKNSCRIKIGYVDMFNKVDLYKSLVKDSPFFSPIKTLIDDEVYLLCKSLKD